MFDSALLSGLTQVFTFSLEFLLVQLNFAVISVRFCCSIRACAVGTTRKRDVFLLPCGPYCLQSTLPLDLVVISSASVQFSSVQLLSRVRLFATPWIASHQASLSITSSRSLLNLMSIESVMPSSHLILCLPFSSGPQSLPASGSFPMSQLFTWGGQCTGISTSVSVLPVNTQDWSSGWTGWISLQSRGLSRVFSLLRCT